MEHRKFKLSLIFIAGKTIDIEIIDIENSIVTDEDALRIVVDKWHHALSCQQEFHLMRFVEWGTNRMMFLMPSALAGFMMAGETRH